MKNLDTFIKILQATQPELKEVIVNFLNKKKFKPVVGDGFVYAKGDIPILLVAHLDTVHKQIPKDIYYDKDKQVLWSPQGIGGDDRCGVFTILRLLENFKPHILFTEDEEIGCVGAKKVVETIVKPEVKFIVEIDRRGSEDCVFYDCGNKKFQEYIESFGFITAIGSYSDIVVLSDKWEIASVNLSSGYYNEHTTNEIIRTDILNNTYTRVKKILLADKNNDTFFDYQKVYYNNAFSFNNNFCNEEYAYWDSFGYIGKDGKWYYWDEEEVDKKDKKNNVEDDLLD